MKIVTVAGARPNFMKIAPIIKEFKKHRGWENLLVHTGQHYDEEMCKFFFNDLGISEPDVNLGVGSGLQGEQTGKIMIEFEKILFSHKPDLVTVVGDVNSTLACALVAAKLHIKVAHVEAGLRSFDKLMPEEVNRKLTDQISDYLFAPSPDAVENLIKEGIPESKIFLVGNIMIDTLINFLKKAEKSDILKRLRLSKERYAVLTLHRPSNVDNRQSLTEILSALNLIRERIKIVFPIHPRMQKQIKDFGLENLILGKNNFIITNPLGYLEFLKLISEAKFVLTDSGGIQEETTVLGIPCLTLRKTTERPITVKMGTNIVVGSGKKDIVDAAFNVLEGKAKKGQVPELWDGKTAERIVDILANSD